MSLAESAVLLGLHAVRMSLLILCHVVVTLLALRACQCDLCAHDFHLHLYYRSLRVAYGLIFEHKKKTCLPFAHLLYHRNNGASRGNALEFPQFCSQYRQSALSIIHNFLKMPEK